MVAGGSADIAVHIWDELSTEEVSQNLCIYFISIYTYRKISLTFSSINLYEYLFTFLCFPHFEINKIALLQYLPGHSGCVNSVVFHPKENVIASGSSDKSIYFGELSC